METKPALKGMCSPSWQTGSQIRNMEELSHNLLKELPILMRISLHLVSSPYPKSGQNKWGRISQILKTASIHSIRALEKNFVDYVFSDGADMIQIEATTDQFPCGTPDVECLSGSRSKLQDRLGIIFRGFPNEG